MTDASTTDAGKPAKFKVTKLDINEVGDRWCGNGPPGTPIERHVSGFRLWLARRRFRKVLEQTDNHSALRAHGASPGWRRRCWEVVRNFAGPRTQFPFQKIPSHPSYSSPKSDAVAERLQSFARRVASFWRKIRTPPIDR